MQPNHYNALVSLLSNVLEAYTTAFFVHDPKTRQLSLIASQSLSKHLSENVYLPLEQSGILSQAQKFGQTIHLDKLQDLSPDLSTTVPFYREGESHIKGLFVTPVGEGAGVLYVDTKYSWGFNDKQQKLIREVAVLLHNLLKQQYSMQQQRDYARIFQFWHRLESVAFNEKAMEEYCETLIYECAQFLRVEYGFLALRESSNSHYHVIAATSNAPRGITSQRLSAKQGLVGWIFQNEKNLQIPRLNPQTPDHYLFTSSEGLPHHGTFWGLYSRMSVGHSVAMAFLSRQVMEWSAEEQYGAMHVANSARFLLEHCCIKDELRHFQARDFSTGLFNSLAFEAKLESILASSMQSSTPFTLALAQFEHWQVLTAKAPPKQIRQWQAEIAAAVVADLPAEVVTGQLAENRFGFIFPGASHQDAQSYASLSMEAGRKASAGKIKGFRLQPYFASVTFPQDGTRTDELWPLVSNRLLSVLRSKIDNISAS